MIDGVRLIPLKRHDDERGYFFESFRQAWMPGPMVQGNVSFSKAGVLRGMHYHMHQADFWVVLSGHLRAAVYDLRRRSSTFGRAQTFELNDRSDGLYIPAGVAHGFYAMTGSRMTYMVDQPYDASDEHGVLWSDLGIVWGIDTPVLSKRDRENPRLAEIELPL